MAMTRRHPIRTALLAQMHQLGFAAQTCPPGYSYNLNEDVIVSQVMSTYGQSKDGFELTDLAYAAAYPSGPFPIPENCQPWADAWMRLHRKVKEWVPALAFG